MSYETDTAAHYATENARLGADLAEARAQAVEAREERDERETLVQQYRAQHDVEAQRRGCPFCTCDVCAAAMRRTVLP